MLDEVLLVENQRFYEVIFVTSKKLGADAKINPVGSLLWRTDTPEAVNVAADYLAKTIAHYKRVQLHGDSDVQHIIDAYTLLMPGC